MYRRVIVGYEGSDHSDEADLLVVGSRGYGPFRRVLLGSVSAKLAESSPCPFLVCPRGLEDGPTPERLGEATAGALGHDERT